MAASSQSDSAQPDSPRVYLIPPIIFLLCLIGGIIATGVYGGTISLIPWPIRIASGVVVIVAGIAFMMWGHGRFKQLGVAVKTFKPATRLVTDGAHGHSRNPMYVGFVAILAGLSLSAGSIPMLLSAVVMFLYLDRYVIAREESYLRRAFGEDYKTYCGRVRRWL